MIWILTVITPFLAVPLFAWAMQAVTGLPMPDHDVMLVQVVLAAAPLIALALFSLLRQRAPGAQRGAASIMALVTLLVWAGYHIGLFSFDGAERQYLFGLAILLSPVIIGVLGVYTYLDLSRRVVH